jgi:hypothetical protein
MLRDHLRRNGGRHRQKYVYAMYKGLQTYAQLTESFLETFDHNLMQLSITVDYSPVILLRRLDQLISARTQMFIDAPAVPDASCRRMFYHMMEKCTAPTGQMLTEVEKTRELCGLPSPRPLSAVA